ncbi:hypothetical protein SBA2_330001 [Acidobacteriia bacterium SbA2]|nr:hypothetical protein SBA2_330001 [Acidobacteriia bacterium SbA2]
MTHHARRASLSRRTLEASRDRVQFLPALLFGVDVEGVKAPVSEQSLMFVSRRTPRSHESVIPSEARNLALRRADRPQKARAKFLAESTLSTQSEIPSLRSGQALRAVYPERSERAQDHSEGLGMTGNFKAARHSIEGSACSPRVRPCPFRTSQTPKTGANWTRTPIIV